MAAEAPFELRGLGKPIGHMGLAINISHTQEDADRQAKETVRVFKAENAIDSFQVISKDLQKNYRDARDNIPNILQASEGGRGW